MTELFTAVQNSSDEELKPIYAEDRRPSWWVDGECDRCRLAYCCDHLDECRTKDTDGNWIHPCVAFMRRG